MIRKAKCLVVTFVSSLRMHSTVEPMLEIRVAFQNPPLENNQDPVTKLHLYIMGSYHHVGLYSISESCMDIAT